jgi:hypothetical protein
MQVALFERFGQASIWPLGKPIASILKRKNSELDLLDRKSVPDMVEQLFEGKAGGGSRIVE